MRKTLVDVKKSFVTDHLLVHMHGAKRRLEMTSDIVEVSVKLAGARRLQIELEGQPEKMKEYARKYVELVETIAGILEGQGIGGAGVNYAKLRKEDRIRLEEGFITGIWGIMRSNLEIKYGVNKFGFLKESLDTNEWACDNSSFLVFDVAQKLGIPVKIVGLLPPPGFEHGHMLVLSDNFMFETTSGRYYDTSQLSSRYPSLTGFISSDPREIEAISFGNLGVAYYDQGNLKKAIECFSEAIRLKPEHAVAHNNLGFAYYDQGNLEEARKCFEKALELDPSLQDFREVLKKLAKD